jgi:hypothetical protein
MSRAWLNFWLDALLLVLFSALMAVSVIVRFLFPPSIHAQGWRLWNGNLQDWMNIQFALVAALALGILLHVMLHWSWICGLIAVKLKGDKKVKVDDGLQTIYGVGFMIVLLSIIGFVLAYAKLTIVPAPLG